MRLLLLIAAFAVLAVLPARAVTTTVTFSSNTFGPDREGSVSGFLEVEDRDLDGIISPAEVLDFAFISDFTDTALDFSGDPTRFGVFALPPAGDALLDPVSLAQAGEGAEFTIPGIGFLGLGGPDGFGDVTVLTLAPGGTLGVARLSPGESSAVSTSASVQLTMPLPASAALLVSALALLAAARAVRGGQAMPRLTGRVGPGGIAAG